MSIDHAEQYRSPRYQRTVEIESRSVDGMPADERYKKEAGFALEASGLSFSRRDKILDLACGAGGHAQVMRNKTGASLEARDISENSIQKAREREEIEGHREGVHGQIHFSLGDMGNILDSLPADQKYKLITILGSSFAYLGTKEAHQKALDDYYSLLEPGGRLVMQWRETKISMMDPDKVARRNRSLNVKNYKKVPDALFGKFVRTDREKQQGVSVIEDTKRGDGFYFYDAEVKNTEGLTFRNGRWYDSDGIHHTAFGRAYFDEHGNEENLGETQMIDYINTQSFGVVRQMLEKAGFKNVKLEERQLSDERFMYAIVAEKPKSRFKFFR